VRQSSSSPSVGATFLSVRKQVAEPARSHDNKAMKPRRPAHDPLAAIEVWGQYNNYRSTGLKGSAIFHAVLITVVLLATEFGHHIVQTAKPRQIVTLIAPSPESYMLKTSKVDVGGGGGGGDRDPLPAPKVELPKEQLPKLAEQQIAPPQIVLHNAKPKLTATPTVVVPPQVHLAENHMPNLGNLTSAPMPSAPPSNGTGSGGGIGSGSGGGLGRGHGAGVGPGSGGGIGGGVYKVGAGITAPQPIDTPDPAYTEEARRAKIQGTCILWLIVDAEGHPRDIRVVRGLGYGLDAKALETVKQWRFQPARKDGQPVNVQVSVEVGFRLY
jgi:protein TonB